MVVAAHRRAPLWLLLLPCLQSIINMHDASNIVACFHVRTRVIERGVTQARVSHVRSDARLRPSRSQAYPPMQYQPTTCPRRRGLVILLGWMGAQPHHLDKYGQMWRELGFDTLSFTASPMI